jgi:hypothetical protein
MGAAPARWSPMRWLALAPYAALVALTWAGAGAQSGLVLLCVTLFLTVCFRPNVAGDVVTGWARRLSRSSGALADVTPAVVRVYRNLTHLLAAKRERGATKEPPPAPSDDLLAPVLLASSSPEGRRPGQAPEILGSGDKPGTD